MNPAYATERLCILVLADYRLSGQEGWQGAVLIVTAYKPLGVKSNPPAHLKILR